MQLPPFRLERFFAEHEFATPYLLCASDAETLRIDELLALAPGDRAVVHAPGYQSLAEIVVAGCGVLLLPGTLDSEGDQAVRVGFGRDTLPEGLAALEGWLEGGRFAR